MQATHAIVVVASLMALAPVAVASGPSCDLPGEADGCSPASIHETTDQATSLREALQAHPDTDGRSVLAAQTHQPLPRDLDHSLAHLVDAHRQALATGEDAPLAETLDRMDETLATGAEQHHADQARLDALAVDEAAGSPVASEDAGSLAVSLLDLYRSIGLGGTVVDALAPDVHAAVEPLAEADRATMAQLVTAQARYQAAATDALLALDGRGGPPESVIADALQARADLEATLEAAADDPGSEGALADPWSDPLGLVVVGTPDADRFDDAASGDDAVAGPVADREHQARATARELALDVTPTTDETPLAATVHAASDGRDDPRAGSAWHMLVLDPGGDDTYADNAGGIEAGTTLAVQAHTEGPVQTLRQPLVQDGRICLPDEAACEPFGAAGFLQALGHVAATVETTPELAAPLSALVLDRGGDDTYLDTGDPVQGAARGLASGHLVDLGGDDTYEASRMAQGASSLYGHGLLLDRGGDDTYNADERAQGWAELPATELRPRELGPFEGEDLTLLLAHHAHGGLHDVRGQDDHQIADLRTGHGVTQADEDWRGFLAHAGPPAQLVDLGGPDELPTPTVAGEPVEPTTVSTADETLVQAWINRPLHEPDASPPPDHDRRYKTSVTVDGTPPDVLTPYGVHSEDPLLDCEASGSWLPLLVGLCTSTEAPAPGVLVGSPAHVEDPPRLTITLTGHTEYDGDVAASAGQPHLLVDVLGNDTYNGGDRSLAYAEDGGTAMLVDVLGNDTYNGGDRSLAHARDAGSTAIAGDLDGHLDATTGTESQAFATQLSTTPYTDTTVPDDPDRPPFALLALGHGSDDEGPAHLQAGNASQAYSEGLGTAVLNGTTGDDRYEVHGWGQGVHEDQQLLRRDCGEAPVRPPTLGPTQLAVVPDAFDQAWRATPWAGAVGALVDADGDDTYRLHGDAGQGDAATIAPGCPSRASLFQGPTHASQPGLGLLHDEQGTDTYEQTQDPPRPGKFPDRACGGANETPCRPADDRTWAALDEEHAQSVSGLGSYRQPATIGLGIDGTDNADNASMAGCRGYEPYRPSFLVSRVVEPLLPDPLPPVVLLDCDRTLRTLEATAPPLPVDPLFTASIDPATSDPLTLDTTLPGDAR